MQQQIIQKIFEKRFSGAPFLFAFLFCFIPVKKQILKTTVWLVQELTLWRPNYEPHFPDTRPALKGQ